MNKLERENRRILRIENAVKLSNEGYTQKEIAVYLGLHQSEISRLLKESRQMPDKIKMDDGIPHIKPWMRFKIWYKNKFMSDAVAVREQDYSYLREIGILKDER